MTHPPLHGSLNVLLCGSSHSEPHQATITAVYCLHLVLADGLQQCFVLCLSTNCNCAVYHPVSAASHGSAVSSEWSKQRAITRTLRMNGTSRLSVRHYHPRYPSAGSLSEVMHKLFEGGHYEVMHCLHLVAL